MPQPKKARLRAFFEGFFLSARPVFDAVNLSRYNLMKSSRGRDFDEPREY